MALAAKERVLNGGILKTVWYQDQEAYKPYTDAGYASPIRASSLLKFVNSSAHRMDELSAQKLLTDFVFDKAKPAGSSTLESLEAGRKTFYRL